MARPTKIEQIPNMAEAITEAAWEQIGTHGAAALSLRAIARNVGITAPAIYNYFPDRDALVTALIIDAYTSFGDWQLQARDSVPSGNYRERLRAIGLAYRNWAMTYPQRYQLIFGTPIPGYVAPVTQVLPSSARSLSALTSVVEEIRQAGKLILPYFSQSIKEDKIKFDVWQDYVGKVEMVSLSVSLLIWARVHGLVSLEIGGNMPPFGPTGKSMYLLELDVIEKNFIAD